MNRKFMIILCSLALFSMTACGSSQEQAQSQTETAVSEELQNPFMQFASLSDAEREAGFDLALPESLAGADSCVYRVMKEDSGNMIEVIYQKDGEETGRIRKAEGSGDISGDYTDYEEEDTVETDGISVTCKGAGDAYALAVWENDGSTYAVSLTEGVSEDALTAIVGQIQ